MHDPTEAPARWLVPALRIARQAGAAILEIYQRAGDVVVTQKDDASPLTEADLAAHRIIAAALANLTPDIPLLSEEGGLPGYAERRSWTRYWLIDPLDGTKEFVGRNGEFTVNIALVEDGVPCLGVVHVPVRNRTYCGVCGIRGIADGAWRLSGDEVDMAQAAVLHGRPLAAHLEGGGRLTVVASRRHGSDALAALMPKLQHRFGDIEFVNMGSSLKICLLAEGAADFYPRLAPTCEWDTAAAHAVLRGVGGSIVSTDLGPLRYNSRDEILNPHFFAWADGGFDWPGMLGKM